MITIIIVEGQDGDVRPSCETAHRAAASTMCLCVCVCMCLHVSLISVSLVYYAMTMMMCVSHNNVSSGFFLFCVKSLVTNYDGCD